MHNVAQIEDIRTALRDTSSPWKRLESIRIRGMRYPVGVTPLGSPFDESMADWLKYRMSCRGKEMPARGLTDFDERKKRLPCEMGAIIDLHGQAMGSKLNKDLLGFTWIFIDSDDKQSGAQLRAELQALQVAFLMTESVSSRYGTGGPRWHLFLPLAEPKMLPVRGADTHVGATIRQTATWWRGVHDHVASLIFTLGGLRPETRDTTAATIARVAFVPHRPPGGLERAMVFPNDGGGKCLDLDAFLEATGFSGNIEPPHILKGDVEEADNGGGESTPVQVSGASDGGTEGESTGTLTYKGLNYFGLVDNSQEIEPGKRRVLCPWRKNHESAVAKGIEDDFSSSVTIWTEGGSEGEDGGFECCHRGSGRPGECDQATAADVIRWARKHGCPSSVMPDSKRWGGGVSDRPPLVADAEQSTQAVELPPDFPGCPEASMEPPAPSPPAVISAVDKIMIQLQPGSIKQMRDLGAQAIAQHPKFFKVRGKLINVTEEDGEHLPQTRVTTVAFLRPEIQDVSTWFTLEKRKRKKGEADDDADGDTVMKECAPCKDTIAEILAIGSYPAVRELRGIVTTPVFHRDGVLLQTPGYHHSLRVLYQPKSGERIPLISPDPGRAELAKAKGLLMKVIADFPFKAGEEALSRGVWLSSIYTRLLRFCYSDNYPMFLVNAGASSSGKGKLADSACIISEGTSAMKTRYSKDDAENERVIGAVITGRAPVVVLDNIERGVVLASTAYEGYLTTRSWTTRKIGTSDQIKVEKSGFVDSLWWATGNGLKTSGDMARRTLRINIEDKSGNPAARKVSIPDLEAYCQSERPALLWAALTLLSGFFAARNRGWSVELPPFASFEQWSLVREAVVWCGLPDPFLARGRPQDDAARSGFGYCIDHLLVLSEGKAMTKGDLCAKLVKDAGGKGVFVDAFNFFKDAFTTEGLAGFESKDQGSRSMGKYLAKFEDDVVEAGDGKKYQLKLFHDRKGNFFRVVAV